MQFSKKLHRAHHNAAVKSLYTESGDRFDLTQDKLHEFLAKVKGRAAQFSLSTLEVPSDSAAPLEDLTNLASGHGSISEAHLQEFAATFMGEPSSAAQDDNMLLHMLLNSCTEEAQTELADHEDDYTVEGSLCGIMLLHVIMREASVSVTTDPDLVRQELTNTHLKFKAFDYNVDLLNKWVTRKVKQLRANGEQSTDLRTHLFKAYRSSPDKDFTNYISSLKDGVRDGTHTISAKQLMAKARLKMKDLQRERALDTAHEGSSNPILALQAQFEQRLNALGHRGQGRRPFQGGRAQAGRGRPRGNNPNNGSSNRRTPRRAGQGKPKPVPFPQELKKAGPPADSKVPRTINGVQYYYCVHHCKWGKHPTSECKAKASLQQAGSHGGATESRMARAARAIAAIAVGEDE